MTVVTAIPNRNEPIVEVSTVPAGVSTRRMFAWMTFIDGLIRPGFTGVVTTAKLTGGGVNGSMTFQNGVLVSQVQAT